MLKFIPFILPCIFLMNSLALGAAVRGNVEDDLDNVKSVIGYEPVSPESALISPSGAFLKVKQQAPVKKINGKSSLYFILPPDSGNLQLSIPGYSIIRWSSTPAIINSTSDSAGRRARIEGEVMQLSARILTINARIALWQGLPKTASLEEINNMQAAMDSELPKLAMEQAELERRLKLANDELSRIPEPSKLGERIRVILAEDIPEGKEIPIEYSYTHDGCGWDAIYSFNALPKNGKDDVIDVKLMAEVWQFTGLDWKDTKITLSTRGSGPREPAPISEWVIDSQSSSIHPRAVLKSAIPATMALTDNAPAPETAGVVPDSSNLYATWQLQATGLPQGRARMQIASASWNAPLHWLARPTKNNNKVWLLATYTLPPNQVWPTGQAEFNVNSQSVGAGIFRPRAGEATLYFGADPRVNIQTIVNSRTRSESGFISASKNFTWSWTYIITNEHDNPINIKVERPAPFIVDANINVTNKNKPEPQIDNNEHLYIWNLEVPAHDRTSIDHSVTISSSSKLPLLPDIQ